MEKSYCVDMVVTIKEGEAKEAGYDTNEEYIREEIMNNLSFYGISLDRLFGGDSIKER